MQLLSQQDDFKNQCSMLEEHITAKGHICIFLPNFHCELNPIEMVSIEFLFYSLLFIYQIININQYWGWAKYRYRELPKNGFADAKELVVKYLDACPDEVICWFINQSWHFMSAYWKGLTRRAAASPVACNFVNNSSALPMRPVCIIPMFFQQ